MAIESPIYSIAAITTIAALIASLITAMVALVNMTLTKELKTSEFRQAWINDLREDLSVFFACAKTFVRVTEKQHEYSESNGEESVSKISSEKVRDMRYQIEKAYTKIVLRLNHKECDHKKLVRLLKVVITKQNETPTNESDRMKIMQAIDDAICHSRPLIKEEWDRVKSGEPGYKCFRKIVIGVITILGLIIAGLVVCGTFK